MLKLIALGLTVAICHAGLMGGYRYIDGDSSEAKGVLSFMEETLNARSNSMFQSRVSDVVSIRKQLVNGYNYAVTFEFSETGCTKSNSKDLSLCELKGRKQYCTATVYKPFGVKPQYSLSDWNCGGKQKRASCPGCPSKVDNFDSLKPDLMGFFESETLLGSTQFSDVKSEDVKIISASTQVVSGIRYMMKVEITGSDGETQVCDISFISQPWMTHAYINEKTKCQKLYKRRAGGVSAPVTNLEESKALFNRVMSESNSLYGLSNYEVVESRTQVVAGLKYYLKVKAVQGGENKICDVQLWSRPWMTKDDLVVTKFSCDKDMEKRSVCAGCPSKVDNLDSLRPTLMSFFESETLLGSTQFSDVKSQDVKIISASTQVVAGTRYRLKVEITGSDGRTRVCDISFISQPWQTPSYYNEKTKCN